MHRLPLRALRTTLSSAPPHPRGDFRTMAGAVAQSHSQLQGAVSWEWDTVVLERQHLWKAIPHFHKCRTAPILAPEPLGHPEWMQVQTETRAPHACRATCVQTCGRANMRLT